MIYQKHTQPVGVRVVGHREMQAGIRLSERWIREQNVEAPDGVSDRCDHHWELQYTCVTPTAQCVIFQLQFQLHITPQEKCIEHEWPLKLRRNITEQTANICTVGRLKIIGFNFPKHLTSLLKSKCKGLQFWFSKKRCRLFLQTQEWNAVSFFTNQFYI